MLFGPLQSGKYKRITSGKKSANVSGNQKRCAWDNDMFWDMSGRGRVVADGSAKFVVVQSGDEIAAWVWLVRYS
jgi:hypothetical protein